MATTPSTPDLLKVNAYGWAVEILEGMDYSTEDVQDLADAIEQAARENGMDLTGLDLDGLAELDPALFDLMVDLGLI